MVRAENCGSECFSQTWSETHTLTRTHTCMQAHTHIPKHRSDLPMDCVVLLCTMPAYWVILRSRAQPFGSGGDNKIAWIYGNSDPGGDQ